MKKGKQYSKEATQGRQIDHWQRLTKKDRRAQRNLKRATA